MTQPDPNSRTVAPRRWLRRALFVLAGIALVALLAWVFRAPLLAGVLRRVASANGVDARWTGFELRGLSHLEITGLSATRVPDIDVHAESIELDFDALRLAGGDLGGLRRVHAARVDAEVGPFQRTSTEPRTGGGSISLPRSLPDTDLDIRRAVVHLSAERSIAVTSATVRLAGRRTQVQAERLAWNDGAVSVEHPLELRAAFDEGRFDVETCSWDPRILVDHISGDVSHARQGVFDVEAALHGFEGTGTLEVHVKDDVLTAKARVQHLDAGTALRAYFADPWAGLEAHGDIDGEVRVPLARPLDFTASVNVASTGVLLFGRAFDSVDGRVVAREHELDIERVVVVHGTDVASAYGSLPRPPFDGCTFLEQTVAWVEADVGDLAQLLKSDVGLPFVQPAAGDAPVGPLRVSAALGGTQIDGRVEGRGVQLGPLLAMFGFSIDAEARIDADARVSVPLRDASSTAIDARVSAVDISCMGRHAELLSGRVQLGPNALLLQDTVFVQGTNMVFVPLANLPPPPFDRCTILQRTTAQIRAELRDVPAIVRASEPDASIVELPPHRLAFRATLIGDTLNVEDGSFNMAENHLTLQAGRVPLHEGARAILFDEGLDLALDVDLKDVAAASRILTGDLLGDLPLTSGAVSGRVRLRGNPAGPRGEIQVTGKDLVVRDSRFDQVDVSADLDQERIDVTKLEARSSLGTLSGGGRYVFAEQRLESVHLDADVSDLEQLAPRALPSGALRMQLRADGTIDELDGSLTLRANDLDWRDVHLEGVVVDARADKGKFRIARAFGRAGTNTMRFAGSLEALNRAAGQWRIVMDELVVHVGGETSSIARTATIDVSKHDFAVRDLLLAGAAGSLAADVSWSKGMGCADIHAVGILPRFLLDQVQTWLPRDTQLDADVSAQWEPGSLEIVTNGLAQGTGIDPTAPSMATLTWKASLSKQRLVIEELALRGDPVSSERLRMVSPATARIQGEFPIDPFGTQLFPAGPLELHAKIEAEDVASLPLPEAWSTVRGGLHGSVDVTGDWSNVRGSIAIDAEDISAPGWAALAGLGPATVALHVALGDDVHIEKALLHLVTMDGGTPADIEASGSIGAPLDARAWMARAAGSILDAPVEASVKLAAVDLAPLAARLRALRRTGGRASATVRIGGTLRDLRMEGEATLEDGEIRTTTSLPSVAGVSAAVHFDGARLVIDKLEGEMGGAPFHMTGEVLVFDPEPSVKLAFEGQSILLFRQSDVTVRADATLKLEGPIDGLTLSGELALRDARYSRKFDFLQLPARARASTGRRGFQLFTLTEPPFSNMRLDLHVKAATPFVVANNVIHAELVPDLRLQGTGDLPELRGTIFIEPSRVLLPSGTLRIRSGRIEFRLDQPDVPVLDIQATSHMQGYDVEINVSGPYDNPRVDVSSVPPLAREDVVMLVVTGRPPSNNLTLATGERTAVDVAVYIARDVAAAWLSGEGEVGSEDSLAERVEVVVGAETTKSGVDSVLVRMRLTGKPGERGSGMYVTGERDIYDFYNYGLRFVFTFQ